MNTISGMSFYDSLNKFITGILLLCPFVLQMNDVVKHPLFYVFAFIIGCFFHVLIQKMTNPFLRNRKPMIERAYREFYKDEKKYDAPEIENNDILSVYYLAYYRVTRNGILMNIAILEAFEGFMRNVFLIFLFYLVSILGNCCSVINLFSFLSVSNCSIVIVFLILLIVTLISWYFFQNKIYMLIWEGDYYIRRLDKENEKNSKDSIVSSSVADNNFKG